MKPNKKNLNVSMLLGLGSALVQSYLFAAEPESAPGTIRNADVTIISQKPIELRRGQPEQGDPSIPPAQVFLAPAVTNVAGDPIASPAPAKGGRGAPPGPRFDRTTVGPPASLDSDQLASQAPRRGISLRQSGLDQELETARNKMVTTQLAAPGRGISQKIIDAIAQVPRNSFVPAGALADSYEDKPLDIGYDRVIESPFVVASVADQLDPKASDRVLEIGTGSGYQAAVLSLLVKEVYTVETHEILAPRAEIDLRRMGYTNNVFVRNDDTAKGWPEAAPFDAIVFNGKAEQISEAIKDQLKPGGRLIIPVDDNNTLVVMRKAGTQLLPISTKPARPSPAADNKVDLVPRRKVAVAKPAADGD
jgi:protein-L-isoaspartate(D-aspartate) O-methyltransferase